MISYVFINFKSIELLLKYIELQHRRWGMSWQGMAWTAWMAWAAWVNWPTWPSTWKMPKAVAELDFQGSWRIAFFRNGRRAVSKFGRIPGLLWFKMIGMHLDTNASCNLQYFGSVVPRVPALGSPWARLGLAQGRQGWHGPVSENRKGGWGHLWHCLQGAGFCRGSLCAENHPAWGRRWGHS